MTNRPLQARLSSEEACPSAWRSQLSVPLRRVTLPLPVRKTRPYPRTILRTGRAAAVLVAVMLGTARHVTKGLLWGLSDTQHWGQSAGRAVTGCEHAIGPRLTSWEQPGLMAPGPPQPRAPQPPDLVLTHLCCKTIPGSPPSAPDSSLSRAFTQDSCHSVLTLLSFPGPPAAWPLAAPGSYSPSPLHSSTIFLPKPPGLCSSARHRP